MYTQKQLDDAIAEERAKHSPFERLFAEERAKREELHAYLMEAKRERKELAERIATLESRLAGKVAIEAALRRHLDALRELVSEAVPA